MLEVEEGLGMGSWAEVGVWSEEAEEVGHLGEQPGPEQSVWV